MSRRRSDSGRRRSGRRTKKERKSGRLPKRFASRSGRLPKRFASRSGRSKRRRALPKRRKRQAPRRSGRRRSGCASRLKLPKPTMRCSSSKRRRLHDTKRRRPSGMPGTSRKRSARRQRQLSARRRGGGSCCRRERAAKEKEEREHAEKLRIELERKEAERKAAAAAERKRKDEEMAKALEERKRREKEEKEKMERLRRQRAPRVTILDAVRMNNVDTVRSLLKNSAAAKPASPNSISPSTVTFNELAVAMHWAVMRGEDDIASAILPVLDTSRKALKGKDEDTHRDSSLVSALRELCQNATLLSPVNARVLLADAAGHGDIAVVKLLLGEDEHQSRNTPSRRNKMVTEDAANTAIVRAAAGAHRKCYQALRPKSSASARFRSLVVAASAYELDKGSAAAVAKGGEKNKAARRQLQRYGKRQRVVGTLNVSSLFVRYTRSFRPTLWRTSTRKLISLTATQILWLRCSAPCARPSHTDRARSSLYSCHSQRRMPTVLDTEAVGQNLASEGTLRPCRY